MAQTNAMRDQSIKDQLSMEDILASIRRIIDDGNQIAKTSKIDEQAVKVFANDDNDVYENIAADLTVQNSPLPVPKAVLRPTLKAANAVSVGIPELDSFLESLDAKYDNAHATLMEDEEALAAASLVQSDISKYETRFSETDRTAFAEVGNALAASTQQINLREQKMASSLLSQNARQAVGLSFKDLSVALMKEAGRNLPDLTEQMLKPMLSDWLDNNLPSMVERLVRAEIERIARGE